MNQPLTTTRVTDFCQAVGRVMALTGNKGVDVAIEAIGIPASFNICQAILPAGGHIANIGVHGKPVPLVSFCATIND